VPSAERRTRQRRLAAWVAFPVLVLAAFATLVALNLNGSSIGMLNPSAHDPALVAGTPRYIRSDEYTIATPLAVAAARTGFAGHSYVGLTDTDQEAVAHGAPTRTWVELLKPQNWGYLLLGPQRGLAAHWWAPFVVSMLGVFALLRALPTRAVLAAPLAVLATATPYQAWWSSPAPGLTLGYGALVGAALLLGLRSASGRRAAGWGLLAGVLATAFVLTLYPPWIVSVAMVVAGLVIGAAIDQRARLRRVAVLLAGLGLSSGPLLLAWYVGNRDAIATTRATFYPGQRVSRPDAMPLSWLLDAPLNPLLAGRAGRVLVQRPGQPHPNLSEISASWLPLPVLIVVVVLLVVHLTRSRRARPVTGRAPEVHGTASGPAQLWSLVGVALAATVLLAWATLPLPTWTGTLVLGQVSGSRVPLAVGLAAVLLCALGPSWAATLPRPVLAVLVVGCAALTTSATLWAASQMPWRTSSVSTTAVVAVAVVTGVLFTLLAATGRKRPAMATALAVLAAVSWGMVNPLYHGLGPLDRSPLSQQVATIARDTPGVRVVVFGPTPVVALVRGAGAQVVSGVTFYPNPVLMSRLAPTQRSLWNNYAVYVFVPGAPGTSARIKQVAGTSMTLTVDPCDTTLRGLGATYAVSNRALSPVPACLQLQKTVRDPRSVYRIYRYTG
jgi:hypothetical protein